MDIRVSTEQGRVPVTVLHLSGDVDVTSYEQLQAAAEQAYAGGARYLLLDLTHVGYVSSAGIRAINHIFYLVRAQVPEESDEAIRPGVEAGTFTSALLKLLNPNPRVTEALHITGVDMFLQIHNDLAEAVASF
ncbi:MAG: STAS domain-containing protein [Anaerolineales bacterium]|nr:STAS domain-containing protein [Anaerolineales bacterium]